MKKIIPLLLIVLCFGERITLVRGSNDYAPPVPPQQDYTIKLRTEYGVETMPFNRFGKFPLFDAFMQPSRIAADTLAILVLRAEFVEDDDSLTSGNGKMDLVGFGSPEDGLFYDPPHDKTYFERVMQFVRNYYKVNSFGNVVVNFVVKPDADTVSYQLPRKMRYYCGFDRYEPETGFVYFNVAALEMGLIRILVDAIAAADEDETIDFSDYDEVMIFHAGVGREVSLGFGRFCDIHSVYIPNGALQYYLGKPYILANGGTDTITSGTLDPEMERVDEYMVGVTGTVCHEFGHLLGLPDLYDISGWSNGVGAWDIMGTGAFVGSPLAGAPEGTIPANACGWSRYFLGWVTPEVITNPETLVTDYSLRASAIDTTQYDVAGQTLIKIPISSTEYFLLENRQQDIVQKDTIIVDVEDGVPIYVDNGEYDFFLPGSGILIWHIDDDVVYSNFPTNTLQINASHKGVDLEEADGIQHFDAWWYGDTLEYFGSRYDPFFVDDSNKANHEFGPFTEPNSDAYYGKSLISIDVTSGLDTVMDFDVNFGLFQKGFPVIAEPNRKVQCVSYGDLDNDDDIELVVALTSGRIYAYDHGGTIYGADFSSGPLTSFIAVGDINGDDADDIVFASGFDLHCLDGSTMSPMPGFSFSAENRIHGAPLIYDLDGDTHNEIIVGSMDRKLYCLDASGTNIANFPLTFTTELVSTPCVFKDSEHIIGVLGSNGTFWLVNQNGIIKEFTESTHNLFTYASPVVADMDRDAEPEAAIINGYGTIYVYGEDSLEQWFDILIDTTFYVTPALADLDGDGYLEMIMPNSSKSLYVANRNGTSENNFPLHSDDYIYYPTLVADFDADGRQEIVLGWGTSDTFGTGQLKIIHDRKSEFEFSPLHGEDGFTAPGVIVDLDEDGDIELCCGSDYGRLYVWDFPGTSASWSSYMNSPQNWGVYTGQLNETQVASGLLGNCYIYPSPVEQEANVRFFLNQDADVTVEIMDIVGHKIGRVRVINTTANEYNEVPFDFTRQSNGIYVLRVEADNGGNREVKFKKFAVLK